MLHSEVLATLADVYIDLAEVHKTHRKENFQHYFASALQALNQALEYNDGENMRNDAICFLRLTKLYLLTEGTLSLAQEYFARWRKISTRVEHDYCRTLAEQLEKELRTPILMIEPWKNTEYGYWNDRLWDFLVDQAVQKFANRHRHRRYNAKQLTKLLRTHLELELGYRGTKIRALIRERNLMATVEQMIAHPQFRLSNRSYESFATYKPQVLADEPEDSD